MLIFVGEKCLIYDKVSEESFLSRILFKALQIISFLLLLLSQIKRFL